MNYDLKELLGREDPKLLQAECLLSWQAVQSMRETVFIELETKRKLTINLADHIVKAVPIGTENTIEGLRFRVKVFIHTKEELEALLEKAYNLGASRRPKFMGPSDFYGTTQ